MKILTAGLNHVGRLRPLGSGPHDNRHQWSQILSNSPGVFTFFLPLDPEFQSATT